MEHLVGMFDPDLDNDQMHTDLYHDDNCIEELSNLPPEVKKKNAVCSFVFDSTYISPYSKVTALIYDYLTTKPTIFNSFGH